MYRGENTRHKGDGEPRDERRECVFALSTTISGRYTLHRHHRPRCEDRGPRCQVHASVHGYTGERGGNPHEATRDDSILGRHRRAAASLQNSHLPSTSSLASCMTVAHTLQAAEIRSAAAPFRSKFSAQPVQPKPDDLRKYTHHAAAQHAHIPGERPQLALAG